MPQRGGGRRRGSNTAAWVHRMSAEFAACRQLCWGGGFAAEFTKKASHRLCFRLLERLNKNHVEMVILIFFGRVPKSLQTFKPIRELADNFNTNRVIGIYMIYNIYKFQEK